MTLGPLLAQTLNGLDIRTPGAAEVEYEHVRPATAGAASERVQVALLAYDLQASLAIEQLAQVGADGGPVTGQQDADRSLARRRPTRAIGAARDARQAQVWAHAITLGFAPLAGQRA